MEPRRTVHAQSNHGKPFSFSTCSIISPFFLTQNYDVKMGGVLSSQYGTYFTVQGEIVTMPGREAVGNPHCSDVKPIKKRGNQIQRDGKPVKNCDSRLQRFGKSVKNCTMIIAAYGKPVKNYACELS